MKSPYNQNARQLTIVAQDPALRSSNGRILTAQIDVPLEQLEPGPRGYRVHLIDYDSTTRQFFKPHAVTPGGIGGYTDRYAQASNSEILDDPRFHAQNAYAICMRILTRFEFALGRRVSWSFGGHQLKIAPHAFADANAFYSRRDEGLFFGYFVSPSSKRLIYSCLSHDVVAHETTHALLDGLRERYLDPSSPDQAAFHEGFADVVAMLSVFSLKDVVGYLLDYGATQPVSKRDNRLIARKNLTHAALGKSVLLRLAEQMGSELSSIRGSALRASCDLKPSSSYLAQEEFMEPHRRGEIFVAAILHAFVAALVARLKPLGDVTPGFLDRNRVVEEAADLADYLLTVCIRAIDYCPTVHLSFGDFLSAALTADTELHPDDRRFQLRSTLRESFASYGIVPASRGDDGLWERPPDRLVYTHSRFESMQRDPDEVFRFLWENRQALGMATDAHTRVLSVRPCLRVGPDGFFLRETVTEYVQILKLSAHELGALKIRKPADMHKDTEVTLYGGGMLLFDEYGRLKYHVRNRLLNTTLQSQRLMHLWNYGAFSKSAAARRRFSDLHRMRSIQRNAYSQERWLNDDNEEGNEIAQADIHQH